MHSVPSRAAPLLQQGQFIIHGDDPGRASSRMSIFLGSLSSHVCLQISLEMCFVFLCSPRPSPGPTGWLFLVSRRPHPSALPTDSKGGSIRIRKAALPENLAIRNICAAGQSREFVGCLRLFFFFSLPIWAGKGEGGERLSYSLHPISMIDIVSSRLRGHRWIQSPRRPPSDVEFRLVWPFFDTTIRFVFSIAFVLVSVEWHGMTKKMYRR